MNNDMKVLSIIIPAYNSAAFLDKGISSLLHDEMLEKLDIIIVNDGSSDETAAIAQKYCDRYPDSIRLISQENRGHGGALNTGCNAAVGKYLKAIDADDWVVTDNLPEFVARLENCDSDVVLTHYRTIDITAGEVKNWKSYPPEFDRNYTLAEIMPQWKNFDRSLTFHGIAYKTSFYREKGIKLSEKVFYEDNEFATFPCCHAESILPLDLFIYDYRIGDVEQSVSDENQLKRLRHTETVLARMISEYQKLTLPENHPGREYVARKTRGVMMSYLTTVMLVEPDKKLGREKAAKMMDLFYRELPAVFEGVRRKYQIYCLLNRLHVTKTTFEKVLHSDLYNKIRNNHDFN